MATAQTKTVRDHQEPTSRLHVRAGRNDLALCARPYWHYPGNVRFRLSALGLGVPRLSKRSEKNSRHDRRQITPCPRRKRAQLVQSERWRSTRQIMETD